MISGEPMNLALITRSELQKAVCGWVGAQLQALLEAINDSNKRMPEARDAKGVLRQSRRRRGAAAGEEQPLPPRTGPLGRRRREDGGRPQCCR